MAIVGTICGILYAALILVGFGITLSKWGQTETEYGWGNVIAAIMGLTLVALLILGW